MKRSLFTLGLVFAMLGITSSASAIELIILNDLDSREEGNVLEIENALSKEAPKNSIQFGVLPGEQKKITGGNATYFILSRKFPLHKLKYEVKCDPTAEGKAVITILEVHDENLPAGCKVVRRGHWSKRSGTNWDE
jgi:hypothetical protein